MGLFLIINIFFLFISLVFSESNTPFRGSKDINKNENFTILNSSIGIPKKEENLINQTHVGIIIPEILNNTIYENNLKSRFLSSDKKCQGKSFVMWFGEGVAITTIKCDGDYTAIYHAKQDGQGQEINYIQGDVSAVTFESSGTIKIGEKQLSTISTDIDSPTASGARILAKIVKSVSEDEITKIYSFDIEDKQFDVYLPKKEESAQRTSYSIGYKDKIFVDSSDQNNSKYTLKDDNTIVKGDSASSDVVLDINKQEQEGEEEQEQDGTHNQDSGTNNNTNSENGSTSFALNDFNIISSLLIILLSLLLS